MMKIEDIHVGTKVWVNTVDYSVCDFVVVAKGYEQVILSDITEWSVSKYQCFATKEECVNYEIKLEEDRMKKTQDRIDSLKNNYWK